MIQLRRARAGDAIASHRSRILLPSILLVTLLGSVRLSGGMDTSEPGGESQEPKADSQEAVVQAVWKQQQLDFHYQSFTTFYSCRSLSQKIRRMLRELGADPQSTVRVTGCEFGDGIARMPLVRISVSTPVEATPQALAELEKTRPQRELAARVRNDRARGIEPDAQFPAHWKRVSLSGASSDLQAGDCELIKQLQEQVLPRLSVRVVESNMQCTANQPNLRRAKLEVEALAPLPKADAVKAGGAEKPKGRT